MNITIARGGQRRWLGPIGRGSSSPSSSSSSSSSSATAAGRVCAFDRKLQEFWSISVGLLVVFFSSQIPDNSPVIWTQLNLAVDNKSLKTAFLIAICTTKDFVALSMVLLSHHNNWPCLLSQICHDCESVHCLSLFGHVCAVIAYSKRSGLRLQPSITSIQKGFEVLRFLHFM